MRAFLISTNVEKTLGPVALGMLVTEALAVEAKRSPEPSTPTAVFEGVRVWVPDTYEVLADLDADIAAYRKATSTMPSSAFSGRSLLNSAASSTNSP